VKLDQIKDERVKILRDMVGYRHARIVRSEGSSHYQREEIKALSWALTLIRHAAERGILAELEREIVQEVKVA